MRRRTASDLSTLARLAQNPAAELRPLLLRVQAQTFADAWRRDEDMTASFETIALGLIPLVSDDVLAEIAAILRPIPDAPRPVLAMIAARLGGRGFDDGGRHEAEQTAPDLEAVIGHRNAVLDLAVARDTSKRLDGRALAILVERAIDRRDLARALLARPEPSRFDRAALYRHADRATRALIRTDLASVAALSAVPRPPGLGALTPTILAAAEAGDVDAIAGIAEAQLGCTHPSVDLADEAGRELFALTLLALGLDPAECIRAMILLGAEVSRSVGAMTDLAQLVRTTPWPVAAFLAGRDGPARRPARAEASPAPPRAVGTLRADGRADPEATRFTPAERDPVRIARAGHRS